MKNYKYLQTALIPCAFFLFIALTLAPVASWAASFPFPLHPGWNNLAIPVEMGPQFKCSTLVAEAGTQGISILHVAVWTNSNWAIFAAGLPMNDRVLVFGEGVMVRTAASGTLVLTGSNPLPCDTPTPIPTITNTPTPTIPAGSLFATDPIAGDLRFVPAGSFLQGEPPAEACQGGAGQFTHTLTRNLAVMETEVTRQMWADLKAVQNTLPDDPTDILFGENAANPVQQATWYETVLFANLLSTEQGLTPAYFADPGFVTPIVVSNYGSGPFYCSFDATGYRLLTEGEWEYACRAGTTTPFWLSVPTYYTLTCNYCNPGGQPALETTAWFCANAGNMTQPAGGKGANPWNLKDMHGNVWEWCWDWYAVYSGDQTGYFGPEVGTQRSVRGGGWVNTPRFLRSGSRFSLTPEQRRNSVGFRLARTVN